MLDISRLQEQGGIAENKKTRFDLAETAGQVLLTFEQKITQKDLQVQVNIPEHPVFTLACQDHITQVIYNLLDNAVKFCPQGGNLHLQIRDAENKIYVTIANDGDTIPPDELPLLFDRFHQVDKSRGHNRDSWGLGLYIVKTIICSHGEDISVTSKDGCTEFTFTLPFVN
jgi:signal transduction histidine kinase